MKNDIEKQKFYYPTKFLLCFLTGVCMLAFSAYSVEGMPAASCREYIQPVLQCEYGQSRFHD